MLNVNRLRILIEVASRGSFSAAADALSYTQSAVSQQVAALEAETGVTLLERLARGVPLTPARVGGAGGGPDADGLVPDGGPDAAAAGYRHLPRPAPRGRADARRGRARGD